MRRDLLLTPDGEPNDLAVVLYTESDCWLLAFHLGVRADLPLTALVSVADRLDWIHIFVDLPRSQVLDVRGVVNREVALERWQRDHRMALRYQELGYCYTLDQMFTQLKDREPVYATSEDEINSRTVANALIELHLQEKTCHPQSRSQSAHLELERHAGLTSA